MGYIHSNYSSNIHDPIYNWQHFSRPIYRASSTNPTEKKKTWGSYSIKKGTLIDKFSIKMEIDFKKRDHFYKFYNMLRGNLSGKIYNSIFLTNYYFLIQVLKREVCKTQNLNSENLKK